MRTSSLLLVLTLAALAAVAFGHERVRSRWRADDLVRLAPGLDRELAIHVVADSDPQWLAHCGRVGSEALGDAIVAIGFPLRTASYPGFLERRRPLESACLRICQGYARVFDFPLPERMCRRYMAMSAPRDF